MKLYRFDQIPENFFDYGFDRITELFPGPSLIELYSDLARRPLFIGTLLHGNERTGYLALKRVLKEIEDGGFVPARPIILFLGNPEAARLNQRIAEDGARDYNRIWAEGEGEEFEMARELLEFLDNFDIWASVDIHNNTGKNPFYGCVNRTDRDFLRLARVFSSTIIYFTEPHEVLSNAMASRCPSLTLECGISEEEAGIDYMYHFLKKLMTMESFKKDALEPDAKIYHTVGRIKLPSKCSMDFDFNPNTLSDFSMMENFDSLNFTTVKKGTVIGYSGTKAKQLMVLDNADKIVTYEYLSFIDGQIIAAKDLVPSMFTQNIKVIKNDSLGYLMEEYDCEL